MFEFIPVSYFNFNFYNKQIQQSHKHANLIFAKVYILMNKIISIILGERPFQCDEITCGKTFTRNEELTRHKRIHSGLRPYPCEICNKAFGRRDHLKKHTKTHITHEQQRYTNALFMPIYAPYLYGYWKTKNSAGALDCVTGFGNIL